MPRKGENIYKRKDGRWEGRYIKSHDRYGRAKYGYVYGKSYREAKQKRHNALMELNDFFDTGSNQVVSYIDSVSFAVNLIVLLKLFAIGLLLAAVSSLSAVISILRYDPLRILSERDFPRSNWDVGPGDRCCFRCSPRKSSA